LPITVLDKPDIRVFWIA